MLADHVRQVAHQWVLQTVEWGLYCKNRIKGTVKCVWMEGQPISGSTSIYWVATFVGCGVRLEMLPAGYDFAGPLPSNKVLSAASSSLGPAHLGTTCSTPKNLHNFVSVSPITVHTTTEIACSFGLDFQYRSTSNPLSCGNDRSKRMRSGASFVPSTTSRRNMRDDRSEEHTSE